MANHMNNHVTTDYDILIIGAGIVGITLLSGILSSINNNKLKIAIIDKNKINFNEETTNKISLHRSSVLNYGTKTFYKKIGIWHKFEKYTTPIVQLNIQENTNAICCFSATEENVPALGYSINHNKLQNILKTQLSDCVNQGQVTILDNKTVNKIQPISQGMHISLHNNEFINAKLVVVADGGNSNFINNIGISRKTSSYQQTAIICQAELANNHRHTACKYFTNGSSIALLPAANNTAGIVWVAPDCQLDYLKQLNTNHFLQQLQQQLGDKQKIIFSNITDRYYYPLKMSLASEQVRPNLVMLGNAAHSIHPVAAQGYNIAVSCCDLLIANIHSSLQQNKDIGDFSQLLAYEQQAKKHQLPIIAFSDSTVKIFAHNSNGVKYLRNMALFGLNKCKIAKSYIAHKALGMILCTN